ncbi:MAG TPA: DUF5947 family protein [Gemmataceae bacterium]|nr:DUF5947 family protein [Gemmataceae bacterium]
MNSFKPADGGFATLQRLVPKGKPMERCELCAAELSESHRHLVEPATRKIVCACRGCALLLVGCHHGRFRLISQRVERLSEFRLSDAQWEDLRLPINLAFFFRSAPSGRPLAIYPSPAGPMESLLPLEAWSELELQNPLLRELESDVEALLVNRIGTARSYYRVPIDECYKLVGLLRMKWHGLSGGTEVWQAIGGFFEALEKKAAS